MLVGTHYMGMSRSWDCPECGTHEAMTDSDTFDIEWWRTVCNFTLDKHPVEYKN